MLYVGSGGMNASLAAILAGLGGQQRRQQRSDRERPIPLIVTHKASQDKVEAVHRLAGCDQKEGRKGPRGMGSTNQVDGREVRVRSLMRIGLRH